ncbi:MAG: ATPase domain-containing protein [Candidatus Diapherotrites archaeon]
MYTVETLDYSIERTKSCIHGLDELIQGGFPKGNLIVVSGGPGTGKTVFCWQFLHEGIKQYDEPGVYVALEEPDINIVRGAKQFGWDMLEHIENGKLQIINSELYDFDRLKEAIENSIFSIGARRVVIDPGVIFKMFFTDKFDARKRVMSLGKMLKQIGCTTIITSEADSNGNGQIWGLEEFLADGVIQLHHTAINDKFERKLGVIKMRGTRIAEERKKMEITDKGIVVNGKKLHK